MTHWLLVALFYVRFSLVYGTTWIQGGAAVHVEYVWPADWYVCLTTIPRGTVYTECWYVSDRTRP